MMSLSILSAILGVVGSYITQFIKTKLNVQGKSALVLTIVVSVVLGFISAFIAGDLDTNLLTSCSIVFSLATIAYRFLIADDSIVSDPIINESVASEPFVDI